MVLGVLSDSHDNIWKLDLALPHLCKAQVILHCGDLCSPFVVKRMASGLRGRQIHIVWGNNDGDPLAIAGLARAHAHVHLHGQLAELTFNGCRVAVNHYPPIALGLAKSGSYDLVCYGHDHHAKMEEVGDCILLNPGELMGLEGKSMMALYDTESRLAEYIEL